MQDKLQFTEFTLKFGLTLISILNPLGAVPTYLALTRQMQASELKILTYYCSVTVMATIALGLVLGQKILAFFGISIPSFTLGGGILLANMAFQMISAQGVKAKLNQGEIEEKLNAKEIGVVPLAIPLLSGPGSISTCIIHSQAMTTPLHYLGALVVVLFSGLVVKLVLTHARNIGERLGTVGLNILTRIMGIILLSSAIEMMVKGLLEILPLFKEAMG